MLCFNKFYYLTHPRIFMMTYRQSTFAGRFVTLTPQCLERPRASSNLMFKVLNISDGVQRSQRQVLEHRWRVVQIAEASHVVELQRQVLQIAFMKSTCSPRMGLFTSIILLGVCLVYGNVMQFSSYESVQIYYLIRILSRLCKCDDDVNTGPPTNPYQSADRHRLLGFGVSLIPYAMFSSFGQKNFETKSCYFGLLNEVYLQKKNTRMDCKSRDESNEPT